jgi:hypothetical protein
VQMMVWGLWCVLPETSDGDAVRVQIHGVGGVPGKLLWTRQGGGSRRRVRASGRRQSRGRSRRVDTHGGLEQSWTRIKMNWGRRGRRRHMQDDV